MGRGSLPPGFRFHPTDVELVRYYLKRKVSGKKLHFEAIAEIDIYKYAPWDLPDKSLLRSGDLKWYFFCPREKKYASGGRMNRATSFGYWKTTGKDRCVYYKDEVAGMIKTLVFHSGKAPKGDRTDWVMYEYRLEDKELSDIQDSYVLSVIFKKEGPGPRNGAQYGAPFNEEEWDGGDDDDEEEVAANVLESLSFAGGFTPPTMLLVNQNISIITSSHVPVSVCKESSVSTPSKKLPPLNSPLNIDSDNDASASASQLVNGGDDGSYAGISGPPSLDPITQCNPSGIRSSASYPSETLPPIAKSLCLFSDNDVPCTKDSQALPEDDELLSMLDSFSDEHENASDQKLGGNFDDDSWLGDVDFFNGLGQFTVDGTSNCYNTNDAVEKMFQGGDGEYLELRDLDTTLSFPMEASGYKQVLSEGLYVENNSHHPANPYHATQLVIGLGHSPMLPEESYRYQDQMNAFTKEKANYGYDVHEASLYKDSAVTRLSQDKGSGCPFDARGDMFGGVQNGLPNFEYMENLQR